MRSISTYGKDGLPVTLTDYNTSTPYWANKDADFDALVTSINSELRTPAFFALRDEARSVLEDLGVMGHSFTADMASGYYYAHAARSILEFGYRHKKGEQLWLGTFGSAMGWLAGDYFRGFAVVLNLPAGYSFKDVTVIDEETGQEFIPPDFLMFVVGTNADKALFKKFVASDPFKGLAWYPQGESIESWLEEHVFSLEDVIANKDSFVNVSPIANYLGPQIFPPTSRYVDFEGFSSLLIYKSRHGERLVFNPGIARSETMTVNGLLVVSGQPISLVQGDVIVLKSNENEKTYIVEVNQNGQMDFTLEAREYVVGGYTRLESAARGITDPVADAIEDGLKSCGDGESSALLGPFGGILFEKGRENSLSTDRGFGLLRRAYAAEGDEVGNGCSIPKVLIPAARGAEGFIRDSIWQMPNRVIWRRIW